MRIYFFFNGQHQSLFCHEMARYWQEKLGWRDFAGVAVVKGESHYDFLQNQAEVNYRLLDTIEDIEKQALSYPITPERIREWEKRLDCPLWHLVVADRNIGHAFIQGALIPRTDIMDLATHENINRFVAYYLDVFEQRLETFQPNAVFFTAIAGLTAIALAKVCQWMNIPFFVLRSTRVLDRHIIAHNSVTERFLRVEQRYQALLARPDEAPPLPEAAKQYLDSFQIATKATAPIWGTQLATKQKKVRRESWLRFGKQAGFWTMRAIYFWLQRWQNPNRHLRSMQPFSELRLQIRRRRATRRGQTPYAEPSRIGKEPYVLFPLHLNPEASTMVNAPNFVNQLLVIELLAKNIPLTHKLYVKEHPNMAGRRPDGFYQQIKQFPNVRIIAYTEDIFPLIEQADLVAVITGTAGWEAIMMGQPVITFGDCFYGDLGFSERCSDPNQLGSQIRRAIFDRDQFDLEKHTHKLSLFLSALFENSFPFQLENIWMEMMIQPPGQSRGITVRKIGDYLARTLQLDRGVIPSPEIQQSVLMSAHRIADHTAEAIRWFYTNQANPTEFDDIEIVD